MRFEILLRPKVCSTELADHTCARDRTSGSKRSARPPSPLINGAVETIQTADRADSNDVFPCLIVHIATLAKALLANRLPWIDNRAAAVIFARWVRTILIESLHRCCAGGTASRTTR